MNYTKLIKLLYLADRRALIEWGFTVTGDKYVAMKNGPVLSRLFDLIKGKGNGRAQALWGECFFISGNDLKGEKTNWPAETLSQLEEQILAETYERYKDKSFTQMIRLVHDPKLCPEWSDPGDGATEISLGQILAASEITQDEVEQILGEIRSHETENEYLLSHC